MDNFADASSSRPMLKFGNIGDVGNIEMQDLRLPQ
jgi:hypothetical protein